MKKRIKYTNEPIEFEVVDDFLPPPEKLALKEETVKVTIGLSKSSVNFFKKFARKQHTPYQKMIRKVLDYYVAHYR
ncbi:MAG: CopG family transcriptional regulator [Candidatus Aureabacteria bacterium]|nr:CopG family transcriptional regulator [Candidatus Auribacterota bacterium]